MESQQKVKLKSTTEIGNDSRTRPIFLLGKTDGITFRQVLGIMLIQQVLQNSIVNRRSDCGKSLPDFHRSSECLIEHKSVPKTWEPMVGLPQQIS